MTDPHAELETAQRYARGSLSAAEAAAFEDHLIACDRCQADVKLAVSVRRLARDQHDYTVDSRRNTKWLVGTMAVLAAGLALAVLLPRGGDGKLVELGHVAEPPAYLGMSVRDQRHAADSLFNAAMTSYMARRYDDASRDLRAALAAGIDTIPARFFMASSELMSGRAREAAEAYSLVIEAGSAASAYLAEAHLYRARALLLLGRGDDALSDLAAVSRDSDRGAEAAALADSVSQVLRR